MGFVHTCLDTRSYCRSKRGIISWNRIYQIAFLSNKSPGASQLDYDGLSPSKPSILAHTSKAIKTSPLEASCHSTDDHDPLRTSLACHQSIHLWTTVEELKGCKHEGSTQCWFNVWASVKDDGPTLNQHCANVSYLLVWLRQDGFIQG